MNPFRAVTDYVRDEWPDRARMSNVYLGVAAVGTLVGVLVGWARGDAAAGAVLGFTAGVVVGVAWVLMAVATRPRPRRWRDPDPDVFVKRTSRGDRP